MSIFPKNNKIIKKVKFAQSSQQSLHRQMSGLATVCEESRCPNQAECFAHGVATILVMGNICTRHCRYCNINHGKPQPLQSKEKEQVWQAIQKMKSSHIVLTTVSRDDLSDGGARYLAELALFLKDQSQDMDLHLEFLLPDFQGNADSWRIISEAPIDVFAHNMELVPDLFSQYRPQGDWQTSLDFLRFLATHDRIQYVKSGFMVGFGEKGHQVYELMQQIKDTGVSILTIGQYLPPASYFPQAEMISQAQFLQYETWAQEMGFDFVFSGPFVRSSYLAHKIWKQKPHISGL